MRSFKGQPRAGPTPWFDIEEVEPGVLAITEPGHYEYVRSYLVIGTKEAALIDTGTGIGNLSAVVRSFTTIPMRVILTHTHWDHIGNAYRFNHVFAFEHPLEHERIEKGLPAGSTLVQDALRKKHFGRPTPTDFKPHAFSIPGQRALPVRDGDLFNLGNRQLRILHTPGHTPGSIAVFDSTNGLLFTGDTFYLGPLMDTQKRSIGPTGSLQ